MSEHCSTCQTTASSSCWNTHLGWCSEHRITFPSERNDEESSLGTPCPTCLNIEFAASEAYSLAQANAYAAKRAVEKARKNLSYSLAAHGGQYAGTPDHQLLVAVETAEKSSEVSEVERDATYRRYQATIAKRATSQKKRSL